MQRTFYSGLAATLGLLLVGWWQGSMHTLAIPGGRLIALSRLFGLVATYTILLEVLLLSRAPFLEENFDLHEVMDLHRLNGYGILLSISAHIVFVVLGYAAPGHVGLWHEFVQMNVQYEDVFKATLGTIIFFGATALSVKIARDKLPYELWFATHLMLYAAILLTTLHQLPTGGDFIGHFWFTAYWYMWYIGVFGVLTWYRFLRPLMFFYRFRFRVAAVAREAADIYSVYVTGRNIAAFRFKPGQYATWWMLTPKTWWQSHPFSFSGRPGTGTLRFTVKASGNFTNHITQLKPGTPLVIDGPRGSFTTDRAHGFSKVMLLAGGIGVAPYLSTIDDFLASGKSVTLLYGIRTKGHLAFREELLELQKRGLRLELFVRDKAQHIAAEALVDSIDDATIVYVCGPDSMSRALSRELKHLGVPERQIVTERFAY